MTKKFLKCVDSVAKHSAFSDLILFHGRLVCCFRAASAHVSDDGMVKVLTLDVDGNIDNVTKVRMANCDLRDPKLSVNRDGKLILLAYARFYQNGKHCGSQAYVWFSGDGKSFSSPRKLANPNHWLWRLSWHKDKAYGFAYHARSQTLNLYGGNPLRTFELIAPQAMSLEKHGLGYPNESALEFAKDDTAYAVVRRDADSGTAQLGRSVFPYKKWKWQDLGAYIAAPQLILLNDEQGLIAGRIWHKNAPKTALISISLNTGKLQLKEILPSAGDCSYPGMIQYKGNIYLSYYSMHQKNKCAIYLYCAAIDDYR